MELEEIVSRLAPGLLRYCLGRTGDRALAEDAAQEALAALVGRWRRHGPPRSPDAFAFGIARRRAGRLLLRRRLGAPLEAARGLCSGEPGPAARLEGRERLRQVLRALAKLPPGEREALLMVVAGELRLRSAAALLGVSVPALKMRLHRARKRLGELLEAGEPAGEEVRRVLERA